MTQIWLWVGADGKARAQWNAMEKHMVIINYFPGFQYSPEPVWLLRSLSKGRKWVNWGLTGTCQIWAEWHPFVTAQELGFAYVQICRGDSIKTSTYPVTLLARLSSFSTLQQGFVKNADFHQLHCRSKERGLAFQSALSPSSGSWQRKRNVRYVRSLY